MNRSRTNELASLGYRVGQGISGMWWADGPGNEWVATFLLSFNAAWEACHHHRLDFEDSTWLPT